MYVYANLQNILNQFKLLRLIDRILSYPIASAVFRAIPSRIVITRQSLARSAASKYSSLTNLALAPR